MATRKGSGVSTADHRPDAGNASDAHLAATFQSTGAEYERYRPGFPEAAATLVVPERVASVLDLGAGTGKLTELLVARADRVTAIDPSVLMLAQLRAKLPTVRAVVGSADEIDLPGDSQDVVTVAQAFHWFDTERACTEISRVLRPGGTLALLWNGPVADCAWDVACHEIAHPGATTAHDTSREDGLPSGLARVDAVTIPWTEQITRADYLQRWLTVSSFLAARPAVRAQMLARVEAVLDDHAETSSRDVLHLRHQTLVERYRNESGS